MKGYPKHLNSKEDYIYVKENFPKEYWEKDFQNLLDTRCNWVTVKELESKEDGIEDSTHKIIEAEDYTGAGQTKYYQTEYKDIKTAPIHVLGFTVKEIEQYLSEE